MNIITKCLLTFSKANIFTLSKDSHIFFTKELPANSIYYIKTGVDTSKFVQITSVEKRLLREKYNIPTDKVILLHIGHLKHERNIDAFLNVDERFHVVLVFSSITEKDEELKNELLSKNNIQIIEEYIPNIQEIYQCADAYVFPVVIENNSIDIPLSVLEAASCNIKVLTTPYKEIKFFKEAEGFAVTDKHGIENICEEYMLKLNNQEIIETRNIALEYDWNRAIDEINSIVK